MKKGFTLIELLVVVAIIALMSSVVVAALATARAKARDGARIAAGRNLKTALSIYESDKNSYRVKDGSGNYAGPNCDGTGPVNKTGTCSFGASESIAQVLGEQGYLSAKAVKDVVYGDNQYYVSVCDSSSMNTSYDVFMKLEKNGTTASGLSGFCGSAIAGAYGYNDAIGAQPGGTSASTVVPNPTVFQNVLPTALMSSSCVSGSTGTIYCFGGDPLSYTRIVTAFDPNTNTASIVNSNMFDSGRGASSCVMGANGIAYCFGGGGGGYHSDLSSFNPSTGASSVISSSFLPTGMTGLSCVSASANGRIYCFGGTSGPLTIEYTPGSGQISAINKNGKIPGNGVSCANSSITNKIYCFNINTGSIYSYDPMLDATSTMASSFATSPAPSCVAETSGKILCLIINPTLPATGSGVYEYDPVADNFTLKNSTALAAPYGSSCTLSIGTGIYYCLGAYVNTNVGSSTVVRYLP